MPQLWGTKELLVTCLWPHRYPHFLPDTGVIRYYGEYKFQNSNVK